MAYALLAASPRHSPHDQLTTSRKSRFKVPSRPRIVPTLDAEPSLQDLRCAVGASEFSIAPADRAAHSPRFPSLAAFERRPGGRCPCGDLCDRGRHPKPVTTTALSMRSKQRRGTHSISPSACAMRRRGTVSPSALAVLRLITSSNLVGCSTGRSPGLAPFRILST
jgi:hypothetical protein